MRHIAFPSLLNPGLGLSSPVGQSGSRRPCDLPENAVFPAIFSVLISDSGRFDWAVPQSQAAPAFSLPLSDNLPLPGRQWACFVQHFTGFSLFVSRTKPFWIADFRFPIEDQPPEPS